MNIGDEKQIQSVVIEILQDCVSEDKKIIKRLQAIIILLIVLLFGSFVYYTYELTQFDFEDVVTTATSTDNNSNINNSDNANAQNNININTPLR
jgi:hypothetical protein